MIRLIFNQLEMRVLYSDVLSMSDLYFSLRQDKSCLPLILNDLYTALLNVNEQVKRLDQINKFQGRILLLRLYSQIVGFFCRSL